MGMYGGILRKCPAVAGSRDTAVVSAKKYLPCVRLGIGQDISAPLK